MTTFVKFGFSFYHLTNITSKQNKKTLIKLD